MEVKSASLAKRTRHEKRTYDCSSNNVPISCTFMFLTFVILFSSFFISESVCGVVIANEVSIGDGANENVGKNVTSLLTAATSSSVSNDLLNHLKSPTKSSVSSSSEDSGEEYYYSDEDYYTDGNSTGKNGHHHGRRHDKTKLAQVIVYFSVIFIALAGVLVKYFVTEYETSQIKAHEQLSYKRLENPQS